MNFISYKQLTEDTLNWAKTLPRDVDIIVGVERSGMLPATILAMHLHKPVMTVNEFIACLKTNGMVSYLDSKLGNIPNIRKVLIVDDSVSSGRAMDTVRKAVGGLAAIKNIKVTYSALYMAQDRTFSVDSYFRILPHPRMFQWNFVHHTIMEQTILDIDGVLCDEPPSEDSGRAYTDYIGSATPLYIPSLPVLGLVTGRLEKYRGLTEHWLNKMGIKYGFLMMAAYETPEERREHDMGEIKADTYSSIPAATLMIESSKEQAKTIRERTGKEVICIEEL